MINRAVSKGFSLIELLVVVAIIGVLAGVAYPAYQEFIRTANRADAMALLVELTSEMEQYRFENQSYQGAAAGGGDTGIPDANRIMALDKGVTNHYAVTISAATRTSYLLTAVPTGNQQEDGCGTITIGANGIFNYAPLDGSDPPDYCEK